MNNAIENRNDTPTGQEAGQDADQAEREMAEAAKEAVPAGSGIPADDSEDVVQVYEHHDNPQAEDWTGDKDINAGIGAVVAVVSSAGRGVEKIGNFIEKMNETKMKNAADTFSDAVDKLLDQNADTDKIDQFVQATSDKISDKVVAKVDLSEESLNSIMDRVEGWMDRVDAWTIKFDKMLDKIKAIIAHTTGKDVADANEKADAEAYADERQDNDGELRRKKNKDSMRVNKSQFNKELADKANKS